MKFLQNIKNGFTLAEVLITLVIVGVISAMTIPTLMNNTNKQEYVSRLKKAYSTLSQATNRIISEQGIPRGDIGGWANNVNNVYNLYLKHLSTAKECGNSAECLNHPITSFYGVPYNLHFNTSSNYRRLVLADGMQVAFGDIRTDCSWHPGGLNVCGRIFVDVNGDKGPNKLGLDVYQFFIDENNFFYPAGCGTDSGCLFGTDDEKGAYCSCKVLREGAINY